MMKEALSQRARASELERAEEPIAVDPVPEDVLTGVHQALADGETHYTDRPGIKDLRERIAARLGLAADNVIVTAGEKEALYVVELAKVDAPVSRIGDGLFSDDLQRPEAGSIVVGTLDALPGLAGFRLAFIAAPLELAARLRPWKQSLSICTAAPSQRAAILAWPS